MQKIKLKDYKGMCFDIIENDSDKEYGFSEVYDTESDSGECMYGYATYTPRLPLFDATNYEEAVELLREHGDSGLYKYSSLTDVINSHLSWWIKSQMTDEQVNKLDLYVGSYDEITKLLKEGFTGERLLYACTDWCLEGEFK